MINAPAGVTVVRVTQSLPITQVLVLNTPTSVTLTATDPSNNVITCVTSVTAKLLTPPTFTRVPVNQTIEGGSGDHRSECHGHRCGRQVADRHVGRAREVPARRDDGDVHGDGRGQPDDHRHRGDHGRRHHEAGDYRLRGAGDALHAPAPHVPPASVALPDLTTRVTATDFSTFSVTQLPPAGAAYTLAAGQDTHLVPVTLTVTDSLDGAQRVDLLGDGHDQEAHAAGDHAGQRDGGDGRHQRRRDVRADGRRRGRRHESRSGVVHAGVRLHVPGGTSVTCTTTDTAGLTSSVTFTVIVTQSAAVLQRGGCQSLGPVAAESQVLRDRHQRDHERRRQAGDDDGHQHLPG